MADLDDEDYRAIARATYSHIPRYDRIIGRVQIFDAADQGGETFGTMYEAEQRCWVLNGRAAVAEYERRKQQHITSDKGE